MPRVDAARLGRLSYTVEIEIHFQNHRTPAAMLEAFIITLREGVEAALIVGITLAYLAKINRPELRKSVYAALATAFIGSIGAAVVIARTHFNQDIFEGWVMLAAAFFVVTMIIFMMRTGRKLKGEIEGKVGLLARDGSWLGLFAFVFLMVLREGVETVLMLGAISLNTDELLNVIGTVLGVAAAVLFGVMFVKGSVRVNLQKFFRVTTVILFFVAGQLIISGLHELSENGVLPSSRREMAIIGPIVRNDLFFFVTIFALAALMVLFEAKRRQPGPEPASPAERRKAAWSARRERLWMVSVYASSFVFIVLVTAEFIYTKSVSAALPATRVSFVNGQTTIPLKQIYDGDIHAFEAKEKDTDVRFWLYQKPDGKVATVLDACEICGPVGFYKSSTGVVCRNCAAPINPQSVGMPGGCNPVPLKATVTADSVIISETDIAAGAHFFEKH
jgi:high-affinity iron transporter